MDNRLTIREMMAAARRLQERGERFTLLGIGPMSRTLLYAVLELAKERDFPVMLIASRNQVDSDAFGHGYVCGWDQERFVADVEQAKAATGFDGLLYLCRDHGGPWQRDEERRAGLPVEEAMALCKRSYIHDMESGFDLLHIDPTKDPHITGTVPLPLVLERTIDIIDALETHRRRAGLPEVAYEAGTEETNGGLTSVEAFADFTGQLVAAMAARGLPAPAFVVGQTGTLTRLTANVGHFNADNAALLAQSAARHGVGIKEHNGDYLDDGLLLAHPGLGVTATNVAPEFGVVETRACLELYGLERRRIPAARCSRLGEAMTACAVQCERWRKWVLPPMDEAPVEQVLEDSGLAAQITAICGHYTYEEPEVREQRSRMMANLDGIGIDGEAYVRYKLKGSLDRYAYCFGLHGLTARLLREAGEAPSARS